jgi:hypothetical protein
MDLEVFWGMFRVTNPKRGNVGFGQTREQDNNMVEVNQ